VNQKAVLYKHPLVTGIAELAEAVLASLASSNPLLKAIALGVKPELPAMLQALDSDNQLVDKLLVRLQDVVDKEQRLQNIRELEVPSGPENKK